MWTLKVLLSHWIKCCTAVEEEVIKRQDMWGRTCGKMLKRTWKVLDESQNKWRKKVKTQLSKPSSPRKLLLTVKLRCLFKCTDHVVCFCAGWKRIRQTRVRSICYHNGCVVYITLLMFVLASRRLTVAGSVRDGEMVGKMAAVTRW